VDRVTGGLGVESSQAPVEEPGGVQAPETEELRSLVIDLEGE
jgi:hypothetical protein